MICLSTAHAKLRLSCTVEIEDVQAAIEVVLQKGKLVLSLMIKHTL
jgi:DNA replicative helicase MCM subunit Mcm2 (Cdc46/Mcm family)